jgi:hypothetical protein
MPKKFLTQYTLDIVGKTIPFMRRIVPASTREKTNRVKSYRGRCLVGLGVICVSLVFSLTGNAAMWYCHCKCYGLGSDQQTCKFTQDNLVHDYGDSYSWSEFGCDGRCGWYDNIYGSSCGNCTWFWGSEGKPLQTEPTQPHPKTKDIEPGNQIKKDQVIDQLIPGEPQ